MYLVDTEFTNYILRDVHFYKPNMMDFTLKSKFYYFWVGPGPWLLGQIDCFVCFLGFLSWFLKGENPKRKSLIVPFDNLTAPYIVYTIYRHGESSKQILTYCKSQSWKETQTVVKEAMGKVVSYPSREL